MSRSAGRPAKICAALLMCDVPGFHSQEPSMRPTLKELAESLATEQQTRITSFATVQRAQSESKNRDLVNRMLPADVAAALKEGQKVWPMGFTN